VIASRDRSCTRTSTWRMRIWKVRGFAENHETFTHETRNSRRSHRRLWRRGRRTLMGHPGGRTACRSLWSPEITRATCTWRAFFIRYWLFRVINPFLRCCHVTYDKCTFSFRVSHSAIYINLISCLMSYLSRKQHFFEKKGELIYLRSASIKYVNSYIYLWNIFMKYINS